MNELNGQKLFFTRANRRKVEADFEGGEVSSDGGLLLMRETDRLTRFIDNIADRIEDGRQAGKVQHDVAALIRQRVMALAVGFEDLNDAGALRNDVIHQVACEREEALASAPTLCRLENNQSRQVAWAVNEELVEQFIRSHKKAPRC